ncbi:MAG: chemotaxis protein CheA [Rhodocyclaceae bacterium]
MSDFIGREDLLADFLQEAGELLSDVDHKLGRIGRNPDDLCLLDDIFHTLHTIKGGAERLDSDTLATLCHLSENLLDRLRHGELPVTTELMGTVMTAAQSIRAMLGELGQALQPRAADPALLDAMNLALFSSTLETAVKDAQMNSSTAAFDAPDWPTLYAELVRMADLAGPAPTRITDETPAPPPAFTTCATTPMTSHPEPEQPSSPALSGQHISAAEVAEAANVAAPSAGRRAEDRSGVAAGGRRSDERSRDTTIRVDTSRLDQVLNLSGEIGLTKNRLTSLRADILGGKNDTDTLQALDQAVSHLDLLVSDLQNSVMKTRMQPIGRLFQKYPRIARDLARQLGKEMDLVLIGEETEIDKTMIEDLSDPLVHLIRNAVDHGIETPAERLAAGKPEKSTIRLEARQEGDHIQLLVSDDGRGMRPERIRAKAVEKGLISEEEANRLDERQSFSLILLPGFSTKSEITDVSGRGVGMDVVKTNIQKLNGTIEIRSEAGKGTLILISLPLTLAILPVLLVRLGEQPFALPLSMVREILPIEADNVQEVGGKRTLVLRGEILPVFPLAHLLGWPEVQAPDYGVLMQSAERSFILAVDSFAGRDDAVIKSLDDFRPRGVAGVTTLSNGQIVLILDMKEILNDAGQGTATRMAA